MTIKREYIVTAVIVLCVMAVCFFYQRNLNISLLNKGEGKTKERMSSRSISYGDAGERALYQKEDGVGYQLLEIKEEAVASDEDRETSIVLSRYGENAKIIDRNTGKVLWKSEIGTVTGIAVNNKGNMVLVHFASSDVYLGNSIVLGIPEFKKLATLPLNSNEKRACGIVWRWLGGSQLLGLCNIEKTEDALSEMTSLERESDMAVERTLLYSFDATSGKYVRIQVWKEMGDKFEFSGISQRQNALQLWAKTDEGKEKTYWFRLEVK